jgi:hypothetical protein
MALFFSFFWLGLFAIFWLGFTTAAGWYVGDYHAKPELGAAIGFLIGIVLMLLFSIFSQPRHRRHGTSGRFGDWLSDALGDSGGGHCSGDRRAYAVRHCHVS